MLDWVEKLNIPLGRWFGVPARIDWSLTIFLLILAISDPQQALLWGGVYAIVFLHEIGHCLAGRYYGIMAKSIVMYPLGGMATMEIPTEPEREAVVALAGPAVNVLLATPLFLLSYSHDFFSTLFICNLAVLIFNLLPALPMDGGRVLRALFVWLSSDHRGGTYYAARVSQFLCVAMLGVAIWFVHIILGLVAIFVFLAAQAEIWQAEASHEVI